MTSFNSKLLVAVLALAAIGCKTKKVEESKEATFVVEQVKSQQVIVGNDASGRLATNDFELPSQRVFLLTACLKDNALNAPITEAEFAVVDENGQAQVRKTNAGGCILWEESHSYNHFEREANFLLRRTFVAKTVHSGSVTVEIALNPWEKTARDLRYEVADRLRSSVHKPGFHSKLTAKRETQGQDADTKARIDVADVNVEMVNIDYGNWRINQKLDLKVSQNYRISFTPTVLRESIDGKLVSEPLENGNVCVEMVIFDERSVEGIESTFEKLQELNSSGKKQDLTPSAVVSKPVRITKQGVAHYADIQMSAEMLTEIAMPRAALVSVTPLKKGPLPEKCSHTSQSDDLPRAAFYGLLGPLPSIPKMKLYPVHLKKRDFNPMAIFVNKVKAFAHNAEMHPLDKFAQDMKYRRLAIKNVSITEPGNWGFLSEDTVTPITAQELESLAHRGTKTAALAKVVKYLCQEAYSAGTKESDAELAKAGHDPKRLREKAVALCLKTPQMALSIENRDFVDAVTSAPRVLGFGEDQLKLQASIGIAKNTTSGWKAKAFAAAEVGAQIGLTEKNLLSKITEKFGASFKLNASAGANGEWYYARSSTKTSDVSLSITSSQTITVDSVFLEFDATSIPCAIVTPIASGPGKKAIGHGLMVCASKPVARKNVVEPYFFINPPYRFNALNNGGVGIESKLRQVVRGQDKYASIKALVQDQSSVILLEPMKQRDLVEQLTPSDKEYYVDSKLTQSFPGVLSPQ